jgi:DNA invertase Pin-like site-specific DNA recombinase
MIEDLGYARVSRQEQATHRHGLETQLNRLKKAGCTEIFQDIESGRHWGESKRVDFHRICELVKNKQIKRLTVTSLDRLSRESITSWMLLEQLEKTGIPVKELDSGRIINFGDPNEWYESRQKGLQAERESRITQMRTRAGYQNLRDLQKANPRIPYGYIRVNEKYEIDPALYAIARHTIETYLKIKNLPETTRIIYELYEKKWSVAGLKGWLNNPVLIGHTPYGRKRTPSVLKEQAQQIIYNTHPDNSLMTEAEQIEILEILRHNVRIWGKNAKAFINPLSGLVFCGECGISADLLSKPSGGKKTEFKRLRSFYCRTRSHKPAGQFCSQKTTLKLEYVESVVITALTQRAEEIANKAKAPLEIVEPVELRELRTQLSGLETLGNNPAIEAAKNQLRSQIENFEYKHRQKIQTKDQKRQTLSEVFANPLYFSTLELEEKQKIYRALVEKVVMKDGDIEIIYLTDGSTYQPIKPEPQPKSVKTGVRLTIGSKVQVCWSNGDRKDGVIVAGSGKRRQKLLTVTCGSENLVFKRGTGNLVVDGQIIKETWIQAYV